MDGQVDVMSPVFLTADWRRLVMLNFPIDPHELQRFTPRGAEIDAWDGTTFIPGFPIWLWYFCPFDQSSSLDFRGFLERNQATEGDTQWVNYKRSPFSSRSTDF